jgi:hypothetical protein
MSLSLIPLLEFGGVVTLELGLGLGEVEVEGKTTNGETEMPNFFSSSGRNMIPKSARIISEIIHLNGIFESLYGVALGTAPPPTSKLKPNNINFSLRLGFKFKSCK